MFFIFYAVCVIAQLNEIGILWTFWQTVEHNINALFTTSLLMVPYRENRADFDDFKK